MGWQKHPMFFAIPTLGFIIKIKHTSMKKLLYSLPVFIVAMGCLGSCTNEDIDVKNGENTTLSSYVAGNDFDVIRGVVRVQLNKEIADVLPTEIGLQALSEEMPQLQSLLKSIGAKKVTRVFPYNATFDKRHREAGLHLWYDIEYDPSYSLGSVAGQMSAVSGIIHVEELPKYNLFDNNEPAQIIDFKPVRIGVPAPYNDPELGLQWHYHNDGEKVLRSIAGADINLYEAWKKTTGRKDVIIGISDGGVDYLHEDLAESVLINTEELNGTAGKDDDKNGYVDDIYGYNFAKNKAEMTAEEHGTHVAGTVAARTNNRIGVAGVAGGNGDADSGVRLLLTQIFDGSTYSSSGMAKAIVYQADNGAVISQNSWGGNPGGSMVGSVKVAIDYFIKNAGCDSLGNQRSDSPMKGGVVIFAAGNDGVEAIVYPAAYNAVVAVAATAPNWQFAEYTIHGDWIDISAPGGDGRFPNGKVYSTLPNNKYGYKGGTSMACPHVSGIAGLIVSHFGRQGFTNEECKKMLLGALRPVDINAVNPKKKGKLGVGYIDAARALDVDMKKAPKDIAKVNVTENYVDINLSWTAVEDEDDKTASFYEIYRSKEKIDASNYKSAELLVCNGMGYLAGQEINYRVDNLELNTAYYFAIVSKDRWGYESKPLFFSAKTLANKLPVIERISGPQTIRLTGRESAVLKYKISDPDGHRMRTVLRGQTHGVTLERNEDELTITILSKAAFGKHTTSLVVIDSFDAETIETIEFETYDNNPPVLVKPIEKQYLPQGQSFTYNLNEYFKDKDGHPLSYSLISYNKLYADVQIDGNTLKVNTKNKGVGAIEIRAKDSENAETRVSIPFQVVKDELVYQVYPIPAHNELNVRLSTDVNDANIEVRSIPSGSLVLSKKVSIASNATAANRKIVLDVSKLSGGNYMLTVKSGDKSYKQSFIKY